MRVIGISLNILECVYRLLLCLISVFFCLSSEYAQYAAPPFPEANLYKPFINVFVLL